MILFFVSLIGNLLIAFIYYKAGARIALDQFLKRRDELMKAADRAFEMGREIALREMRRNAHTKRDAQGRFSKGDRE